MVTTVHGATTRLRRRPSGTMVLVSMLVVTAVTCAAGPVASASTAASTTPSVSPDAVGRQLITVAATEAGSSHAVLSAWQQREDRSWVKVLGPIPARVGARGIGPAREGSEYTPAGTFLLDQAFGRLADPDTRLPYFATDLRDWWDENPASPTYNLHIRRDDSPGGASENLYTTGSAYNYAVNFAYNPARIPGKGSAFFLHVGTGSATAGCVSIDQGELLTLLQWLDPAQRPTIDIRVGAAMVPSPVHSSESSDGSVNRAV